MAFKKNRLFIIGTGIKFYGHLTLEAKGLIEHAEKLLYLVNEPLLELWIREKNPTAESLASFYQLDEPRRNIYQKISHYIVDQLELGQDICAVFYGHPGIFVDPSHEAIKLAKKKGYETIMLPGISAEDCLFADIGFDPGTVGYQNFSATDFCLNHRIWDSASHLILWQIGCIGNTTLKKQLALQEKLSILVDVLTTAYPSCHKVVLYEASLYPSVLCRIDWIQLADLPVSQITSLTTLYVPPLDNRMEDPEMLKRLGIIPYNC